jgi:hypothetical protein
MPSSTGVYVSPDPMQESPSRSRPIAQIAGGVVGTLAILFIVVCCVVCRRRRRQVRTPNVMGAFGSPADHGSGRGGGHRDKPGHRDGDGDVEKNVGHTRPERLSMPAAGSGTRWSTGSSTHHQTDPFRDPFGDPERLEASTAIDTPTHSPSESRPRSGRRSNLFPSGSSLASASEGRSVSPSTESLITVTATDSESRTAWSGSGLGLGIRGQPAQRTSFQAPSHPHYNTGNAPILARDLYPNAFPVASHKTRDQKDVDVDADAATASDEALHWHVDEKRAEAGIRAGSSGSATGGDDSEMLRAEVDALRREVELLRAREVERSIGDMPPAYPAEDGRQ